MYATVGRSSIAPEKLLRALLLQVLYTIRSERLLMEQLNDNLLFRWVIGLSMDDAVWDYATFSKNRERLIASDMAGLFFASIKAQAEAAGLLSDEHFHAVGVLANSGIAGMSKMVHHDVAIHGHAPEVEPYSDSTDRPR
jgi:transposase